jgi:5-methylcytosine-specific restriction endonuclease McrA
MGHGLLYCSPACEQEAGYVRYFRQVLKDGRWSRPEIQETIRIRGVVVMNGGYPHPERAVSREYREFVLRRDNFTCRSCGQPGNQVDHIRLYGFNGNINHPLNLQVLCGDCHRAKTLADIQTVSRREDPDLWQKLHDKSVELDRRVRADPPERPCDDEATWAAIWRTLRAERRAQLQKLRPEDAGPGKRHLRLVR